MGAALVLLVVLALRWGSVRDRERRPPPEPAPPAPEAPARRPEVRVPPPPEPAMPDVLDAAAFSCALADPLLEGRAFLQQADGPSLPVILRDGVLWVFGEAGPAGDGLLRIPGHLPASLSWDDGGCGDPVAVTPGVAAVVGVVQGADPATPLVVVGCGGLSRVDDDGAFYLEAVPGPCDLEARRTDGQPAHSTPVSVDPAVDHDVVVTLPAPVPSVTWAEEAELP